jgi:hypothetical protein
MRTHPLVNDTAENLLLAAQPGARHATTCTSAWRSASTFVHRDSATCAAATTLFSTVAACAFGRAITETHGVTVLPEVLLASHRRVALLTAPLLTLQATMSACIPPVTAPVPFVQSVKIGLGTLQTVASYVGGPGNSTVAFLSPVYPPADFLAKLDHAVAQFEREFQRQVDHGLASSELQPETGEIGKTVSPGE